MGDHAYDRRVIVEEVFTSEYQGRMSSTINTIVNIIKAKIIATKGRVYTRPFLYKNTFFEIGG